jgi:hypothetical protein
MKTHVYVIGMYLSANGAPPCRTPHVRDAAGAAPNLGAIYHCSCLLPALPLPTPASSARNVPVRRQNSICYYQLSCGFT